MKKLVVLAWILAGWSWGACPAGSHAVTLSNGKTACAFDTGAQWQENADGSLSPKDGKSVAMVATLPTAGIVTVTGTTLTLDATHNGKIIRFTAGTDITVTVPASLGAGYSCLLVQRGAGNVIPTASGMTLRQRQSYTKTAGQYAIATLACDLADDCILAGDLQ